MGEEKWKGIPGLAVQCRMFCKLFVQEAKKRQCECRSEVVLGRVRCALTCVQQVVEREGKHGAMSFVFGSLELWNPFLCHFFSFPSHGERHRAIDRSSTELHGGACGNKCVDGDNSLNGCSAP